MKEAAAWLTERLAGLSPALTVIITGIYDLKRMTQLVFQTRTLCEDKLVYTSEWSMLVLGEGGFGGPRPPKSPLTKVPSDAEPSFSFEEP